jgi:hypothetical protein
LIRAVAFAPVAAHLVALYGLPRTLFNEFCFWQVDDAPEVWMAPALSVHPTDPETLAALGWAVLSAMPPAGVPTAALLKIIGADAQLNVIQTDDAVAAAFARGEAISGLPEATATVLVVRRGHLSLGGVDRSTGLPVR